MQMIRVYLIVSLATVFAASFTSCGGSSGGSSTCPTNAVILADMRDVERDAEGLVSASFGSAGKRMVTAMGWDNARTVAGLLKQTWASSKAKCPGLPAVGAAKIDAALAKIDGALTMGNEDQKTVVYNANAIGLAIPELFDYFKPDAPKAIVNMDAYFRQLGIDAHFGDTAATMADLATLRADWMSSKSAVDAKIPTCSRVGGLLTVDGEIEASLSNSGTALMSPPVTAAQTMTIEVESDNGALEIDTLELLFDCPALAPGVLPNKDLGSICTDVSTCGPGQVCAAYGNLMRCAPSPQLAKIGTPCSTTNDCGTNPRSACNTAAGDGYPGGYCFMEPCNDVDICPPGATCVALGGETPGCFQTCSTDADCRTADGYVCQVFGITPPHGFGPSAHACANKCKGDGDCMPLRCDVASGKCTP